MEDNNQQPQPNIPPSLSVSEIIRRGEIKYDELKIELEKDHHGKYVVIEVESGKHFIGDTRDEATIEARKSFPNKVMFIKRIGQVEKISRHFPSPNFKHARIL